ncbi:hypothetical protein Pth03_05670 [Planotetraspora thailandica]|uniref:DUF4180 domain-containing protein n=1 Tax=Planotetraspora thailandica TaxID=487172 RepID=A0A8J3UVS1_9ACTN|nr:DUF4180 domain-containing protein [Planotetraspora thailandica]GII52178.1 hypothetical protein Pth03_05670 [Planotetraspora thailandica]
MPDSVQHLGGVPVLMVEPYGEPLRSERDALDLIGQASWAGAEWVAVPANRLAGDFFRLRTRVAGEIVQKFANYRLGLAVLGDISGFIGDSDALRDFVRESNAGRQTWFVDDADALADRLARRGGGAGR